MNCHLHEHKVEKVRVLSEYYVYIIFFNNQFRVFPVNYVEALSHLVRST